MKNIIYVFLIIIVSMSIQSCLHENEDFFDKSADERLTIAVNESKKAIESSDNGWHLQYFIGDKYQYGGYNYFLKFKENKVSVWSEMGDNIIETSDYQINGDQGPVLSFSTYNNLIHKFCEGQPSFVDGFEGDYEFIIQNIKSDTIFIKGKKWGNKMIMTRIPATSSWSDKASDLITMNSNFIYSNYKMNIDKDSVANICINSPSDRIATITDESGSYYSAFIVTENGICFAEPIEVHGVKIKNLTYHSVENIFSLDNAPNITLSLFKTPGYEEIEFYEGKWQLYNESGPFLNFDLKINQDKRSLIATSAEYPFALIFSYNLGTGEISLITQQLGKYTFGDGNEYYVTLCPYSSETGYFTWGTKVGLKCKVKDKETIDFYDIGDSGIGTVTGFFPIAFSSSSPSSSTYSRDATSELFDYFLRDLKSLKRVK